MKDFIDRHIVKITFGLPIGGSLILAFTLTHLEVKSAKKEKDICRSRGGVWLATPVAGEGACVKGEYIPL